ncbi:hypothetical protein Q31b_29370 [Novipirellula aureliae]|uniref:Uncharacterized protein n=1 Tax=Novipirellula aureliae TaxID=2527966 RepID=A0A5C6DXV1_9BACT|nr:hypothetical protein Q31b_29370 [Novipirellula aureliae]
MENLSESGKNAECLIRSEDRRVGGDRQSDCWLQTAAAYPDSNVAFAWPKSPDIGSRCLRHSHLGRESGPPFFRGSSGEFVGEREVAEVFLGAWQSRYPLPLLLDSLDASEQASRQIEHHFSTDVALFSGQRPTRFQARGRHIDRNLHVSSSRSLFLLVSSRYRFGLRRRSARLASPMWSTLLRWSGGRRPVASGLLI